MKMTWLNRFAWLTFFATLGLIGIGGLVTSHGVGMAVPDWPTTYGYNMFLFPISQWVGGIFYEHTHRLCASGVGLLTTILMVWLWRHKAEGLSRSWLRWLGVIAFVGVVFQGVLGGLRVTLYKDEIGIFHGAIAQMFLVLIAAIAFYTSPWWQKLTRVAGGAGWAACRGWLLGATLLILLQLTLGAAMRHQHAGLAVPDFPLAYGKIWPPTDPGFIELANQQRVDARDFKPITPAHIHLHMTHRLVAMLILIAVGAAAWRLQRRCGPGSLPARLAFGWTGIILAQATLGAWTVWSNKAADVATLHVVLGAISLVYGSLLTLAGFRLARTGDAVNLNESKLQVTATA